MTLIRCIYCGNLQNIEDGDDYAICQECGEPIYRNSIEEILEEEEDGM